MTSTTSENILGMQDEDTTATIDDQAFASKKLNEIDGQVGNSAIQKGLGQNVEDENIDGPIKALPESMQLLINELSDKYKYPKEFCLTALLYTVSVSIGNKYKVWMKSKWKEIPALYMCIIAPPGTMKTPVINFFTAPLRNRDNSRHKAFIEDYIAFEASKRASTKEQPFEGKQPTFNQHLVNDFTLEALCKVLQDNPNGVGVCVDELAGFFNNLNRYSKGGDVQKILSMYNGDPFPINRAGALPAYVRTPFVSIIGGIQPAVLATSFTPELMCNGMFDRFLFCFLKGAKKEVAGNEDLSDELLAHYESMINFLLAIDNEPSEIRLSADAKTSLYEFRQRIADVVNESNAGGNERLAGVYNKCDYHVIRLSLVLQVMEDALQQRATTLISLQSVESAIRLCDYFMEQSGDVIEFVSKSYLSGLPEDKKRFYGLLPTTFARAEAIKIASALRPGDDPNTVTTWAKRFLDSDYFTKTSHGKYEKNKK